MKEDKWEMLKTSQDRGTREYGTSQGKTPIWGNPWTILLIIQIKCTTERERERADRNIIDLPRWRLVSLSKCQRHDPKFCL